MTIGTNIKNLRKTKGLTQVELAEKLCTTQQTITAYERGKKKPNINKLPDIAAVFGVSIEVLIGRNPVKVPKDKNKQRIHKNSRTAKIQELFEKLPALEQRAILKQVKGLLPKTD